MEHTNGGANGFRQGTPPRNAGNHRHSHHPAVQSHREHQTAPANVIMLLVDPLPVCMHVSESISQAEHSSDLPVPIFGTS